MEALIQRAQAYEMAMYERALRKGNEPEIPTHSTLPIREDDEIIGVQTVYFPNYPDNRKSNTVVRKYWVKELS